jgi:predicted ATPase with chaperone activity
MVIQAAPAPSAAPATPASEYGLSDAPFVPQPANVEETGLELSLIVDLMLKTVYFMGRPSGRALCEQLALSYGVLEELVTFLRQEQALEIVGSAGVGEQAYQYALTERGRHKAEEALARSHYVGPTPVPYDHYIDVLSRQSAHDIRIDTETYLQGLSHLVLPRRVLAGLGPALNSGRSLLVYGGAGNGKSAITIAVGDMLPGEVLIPHAITLHGQIIKVFDPRMHHGIPDDVLEERRKNAARFSPTGRERRQDPRWVIAKRPVVSVGGELSLKDLEMRYSATSNFYIAPLQWKANSGVLIIDDFGRQMIQPQELLNRWIVPMEQGIDHLSLHTGDTVELPFDVLLIFSSNIPPGRLGDEAFFRRIRHKVEVPNPTPDDYIEILKRMCETRSVQYTEEGAQWLLRMYEEHELRQPKACHPRDLVDLLLDITRFYGKDPVLMPEWLDLACTSYFVQLEKDAA